jgi:uncharacterized Zn finger protein
LVRPYILRRLKTDRTIIADLPDKTEVKAFCSLSRKQARGRTYVRNGSIVDLQIAKGHVAAKIAGSELYSVKIAIAPVAASRWKSICRDCAGTIDSVVELL